MKTFVILVVAACLFLQASFAVAEEEDIPLDSLRSITEFDTDLPEEANLARLLSKPSVHTPFSYHQEFMKDDHGENPFSYDPKHSHAPSRWQNHYPACGGNQQSPINIRTSQCVPHKFSKPLKYVNSDKTPTKVTLENNGYSVSWVFEYNGTRPYLTGGPLKSSYVFETMHIHWGKKGAFGYGGSEHLVDSKPGDLEMHMIHRNIKYDTFSEAASHPDGLVVVGVLARDSLLVKPMQMFKNLNDVRQPMSSVELRGSPKGYILRNIIGFVGNEPFVAYKGSLTTPPCSETALWLVPKNIRSFAHDDLMQIHKILGKDWKPMGPNNRPVQKSNNRSCILFKMPKQN